MRCKHCGSKADGKHRYRLDLCGSERMCIRRRAKRDYTRRQKRIQKWKDEGKL